MRIDRVRDITQTVRDHASDLWGMWCDHVKDSDPSVWQTLAPVLMRPNAAKHAIHALCHVAEYWDESAHARDYLRKLGKRLNALGVQTSHLDLLHRHALAVLAHVFGPSWTQPIQAEWMSFAALCQGQIALGMQAPPDVADPWPTEPFTYRIVRGSRR